MEMMGFDKSCKGKFVITILMALLLGVFEIETAI